MTTPNREQFANNASTTLNGNINNSTTSVVVTTGSVFPSSGSYRVKCGDEIMLVTSRSSNTLTVVRGYEGTTAVSHNSGDSIASVFTAGSFNRGILDSHGFWAHDSQPPFGLYATDGVTLLTTADFSWVNQGSSTVTDQNGMIVMDAPPASGENLRMQVRTAPSPTYSVIAAFHFCGPLESGSFQSFGLCFRQSTSGKVYGHCLGADSGNETEEFSVYKWTNPTTNTTALLNRARCLWKSSEYVWLKMTDNNTNLLFYGSLDGVNWVQLASEARGTFMTLNGGVTGPDQVGWFINNYGTSTYHCLGRLVHWSYST